MAGNLSQRRAQARDTLLVGLAMARTVHGLRLPAGDRVRFLLVDPDGPAVTAARTGTFAERDADNVRERVPHSLKLPAEIEALWREAKPTRS